jgi:murein DD-endopeptidase MepM/ murein hydrolase activator NlpD
LFRSRTGGKHEGLDIAAPNGTEVHAAMSGEVVWNAKVDGYGWVVVIKHADGTRTLYAHLQQQSTASGWVKRGTVIGQAGNTGNAGNLPTAEQHLHFGFKTSRVEFKKGERFNDPLEFLNRSLVDAFDSLRNARFH